MPADQMVMDEYLDGVIQTIAALPRQPMLEIIAILRKAQEQQKQIFVFGNGGSSATASHMANDLVKNTRSSGLPLMRVISLSDNMALFSAFANDEGYENVFAQQLRSLANSGDIAIAISGSGNSPNVLKAIETARQMGLTTIGLGGFAGGKMKDAVDICLVAPCDNMEQIEDIHLVINHVLASVLRLPISVSV
ncbi:MAG: SIS domain-containing protein [Chloroflexi bacterium]|nr:SIS domain-containing protein [Chloroflexota bacterium]